LKKQLDCIKWITEKANRFIRIGGMICKYVRFYIGKGEQRCEAVPSFPENDMDLALFTIFSGNELYLHQSNFSHQFSLNFLLACL